ncbi:Beta-adrenergic receptor kinase 2 [Oopsacas minuta]|uniref:G protein-coupled receptor kinase n=1 Tax=Oopsacas minuta TaxID=111878 RepID=A0AAV7K9R7_9METZ|nr:Beta-adrenergic receptor kinase 2 [Oopsacas minuta]
MSDIETVLADVSYIMAVSDSKSGKRGGGFTRKKVALPDTSIQYAMGMILFEKNELTFEAVFIQPIAYKIMLQFAEHNMDIGAPLLFYDSILSYEKESDVNTRIKMAKEITDRCMMPDYLSKELRLAKTQYDQVLERMYQGDFSCDLFRTFAEPLLQQIKENVFDNFQLSKEFTRFCQWKALEMNFKPSLQDFNVHRKLGRGGYGEVYGCRKIDSGRVYAMKVSYKKRIKLKNGEGLAINERNILCKLNNPFIVGLHYAFQTPDQLVLVLDLAEGGDLHFHIDQRGALGNDAVRFYTAEMVLGLEHMHSQNIIYRDMKPSNVLLDTEGHVKISDLGLAHDLKYSFPSSAVGTHGYMAPEVIYKGTKYSFPVDWFALGCTIYKISTGHSPFHTKDAKDRDSIINKTLKEDPVYPSNMTNNLRSLISSFLTKNPASRLGSPPNGVEGIKNHPFFDTINWTAASSRSLKPPFLPPTGEVNAAEVDDIGSFDSSETHKVKLNEEDQRKYDGYDLTMPLKWQEEMIETLYVGVNEARDKIDFKEKKKSGAVDMIEDYEKGCVMQGWIEKQNKLSIWIKKYMRVYESRIEICENDGAGVKSLIIPIASILEIKEYAPTKEKGNTKLEIIQRDKKETYLIKAELEVVTPVWSKILKSMSASLPNRHSTPPPKPPPPQVNKNKVLYHRYTSTIPIGANSPVHNETGDQLAPPKLGASGRSKSEETSDS